MGVEGCDLYAMGWDKRDLRKGSLQSGVTFVITYTTTQCLLHIGVGEGRGKGYSGGVLRKVTGLEFLWPRRVLQVTTDYH